MHSLAPSATLPHPPKSCPHCRPVRLPNGAASGCWRCGGVLLRHLRSTKRHLLEKPPAIAFHADFWQAQVSGLRWVLVIDTDTARTWLVSAQEFERRSMLISRGHGLQWALPLRYWRSVGRRNGQEEGQQLALALETAS